MVFFLVWHVRCSILGQSVMNSINPFRSLFLRPLGLLGLFLGLLPSLVWAHPGHYHPDETDEFDWFRAAFFHSHGALDWVLGLVAVISLSLAFFKTGTRERLGALGLALGALSLISIF
jgi:hypothetical protein